MKYARIINSTAVDTRDTSPDGCFTPNIVAEFIEVPDDVQDGWILDGGTWSAPPAPEPTPAPEPIPPTPPKVSPVEFKLLFTAPERVAIKTSDDPVVQDFFELINDPRLTHVNLALQSTQDALDYLTATGVLASGRKAEILTGNVQ